MGRHDRLFKELFETFFGDLLSLVVPRLRPKLRPEAARFLRGELFVDSAEGAKRQVDLLAEVPSTEGRRPRYVLVHVEVEARARRSMARRLCRYAMMIRLRHDKPVLPIVVYLRGGKPDVVRETYRETLWGDETLRFHYYAFGLSGSSAEHYLEKDEPLAWALSSLMQRDEASPARHKLDCMSRVSKASLQDSEKYLLAYCVENYLQLGEDDRKEYRAMLAEIEDQGLPEVESWSDYQERLRQEGRLEALRRSVLKVLERRFGRVPTEVRQRVEALSSVQQLDNWLTRALEVGSPEELS